MLHGVKGHKWLNAGMLHLTFDLCVYTFTAEIAPYLPLRHKLELQQLQARFRYVLWLINKPNYSPGSILGSWLWQPRAEDGLSWSVDTASIDNRGGEWTGNSCTIRVALCIISPILYILEFQTPHVLVCHHDTWIVQWQSIIYYECTIPIHDKLPNQFIH